MFSYNRLNKNARELRLVRFGESVTSYDGDISLILGQASLNDNPAYHAFSYVWGNPTPASQISLNNKPLTISHNLYNALLQLHRNGVEAWFWVDAICINQTDLEEKTWQTAQMRDVFGQANLVYIWLGPNNDNSDLVLEMTQRIGPDAHKADTPSLWIDWPPKRRTAETSPENDTNDKRLAFLADLLNDKGLRSSSLLNAIKALLSRTIWCRSWIMQEIALARYGLVMCGTKQVSLEAFNAALTAVYFAKNCRFARQLPQWRDFGAGLDNNVFHIRGLIARRQRQRGHDASLLNFLLCDFRASPGRPFYAASDPRDVIFGILGIAADTNVLGLRPNYIQTVAEAYTVATRAMLERCAEYRLEFSTFPKDTPGLPSWVPDWRRIGVKGIEIYPISYRDYFRGSRNRIQPPFLSFDHSGSVLRRRGCLVDVVVAVLGIGISSGSTLHLAAAMACKKERAQSLLSILEFATPYLKDDASEAALWRTLVTDWIGIERCESEYDALARQIFRQERVLAAKLTEEQRAYILRSTYPYPCDPRHIIDIQAEVDAFSDKMWQHASACSRGRTLFVTSGMKFGLGPETMRREDVVTILFGTQVPIVLRSFGDNFTYLGDAYVHGIMDGEFMNGNRREKNFDIA